MPIEEKEPVKLPIHPWVLSGELPKTLPKGKGVYWHWGPNYTADPIVLTKDVDPLVLLVTRGDNGLLALPGGFVDGNGKEDFELAARRELEEETHLSLTQPGTLTYQGIVADERATLNAWPETSAYLYTVDNPQNITASDDAKAAGWYPVSTLDTYELHGSHRSLISQALHHREQQPRTIETILSVPEHERQTIVIEGGHMAYDHLLTSHGQDVLFIKRHEPSRFSDPSREAHSRAYLQKEHALYSHLRRQGFVHIPRRVSLIGDHTLAMDAMTDATWVWRAPKDQLDAYIRNVSSALDALHKIDAIENPTYTTTIDSTYNTLWREGWDAIDTITQETIIAKIRHLSHNWDQPQRDRAGALIMQLPELSSTAATIDRFPPLVFSHNDARQSNIAWSPEKGVVFVDWSWGDLAPDNADHTMLLVDLAKSGHDITEYLHLVNKDHLVTLIGFWLAHSIWKTRDDSTSVREHQIASASIAVDILNNLKTKPVKA